MKAFFSLLVFLFALPVFAGDYTLYISDNWDSPCTEKPRNIHTWCEKQRREGKECNSEISHPIKSSIEVSESLKQYFNGQKPNISILKPAFTNAHFHFCGTKEVETVYATLIKLQHSGVKQHRAHLDDFISKIEKLR